MKGSKIVIFINGLVQVNGLSLGPKEPGKLYWGKTMHALWLDYFDTTDTLYIDGQFSLPAIGPTQSWLSPAIFRYYQGNEYEWSAPELKALEKVDKVYMISHSQGSAYAEGLALQLFTKGYPVDGIIHLQPANSAFIPVTKQAARWRVVVNTEEDIVVNKLKQHFDEADITITEWMSEGDGVAKHTVSIPGQLSWTIKQHYAYTVLKAHVLRDSDAERTNAVIRSVNAGLKCLKTKNPDKIEVFSPVTT